MKITPTRNYGLFVNDVTNRPITEKSVTRLKKLEASMSKYGFLPFPILVRREGQKLRVIDGQHRLTMAQKLGLAIMYVETERDDIEIAICASGQSPWNMRDYAQSFAAQGKKPYEELLRFSSEHNIPLGKAASLLNGESSNGCNVANKLKSGGFAVRAGGYAARVLKLIDAVRAFEKWGANSNSMSALARFTFVKDFDDARFARKVQAHPHMLRSQSTVEAFSEMYEEIYNHAARSRVPLSFLSREAAAKRSPACAK